MPKQRKSSGKCGYDIVWSNAYTADENAEGFEGAGYYSNLEFTMDIQVVTAVSEPSTYTLAALGLFAIGIIGWRRYTSSSTR